MQFTTSAPILNKNLHHISLDFNGNLKDFWTTGRKFDQKLRIMDSTDISNTLVLKSDDLPPEVKDLFSRLSPGDKVHIQDGTFTLVENGEKVVSLAINDGDGLTIKADPGEESVTFKLGDDEGEQESPSEDAGENGEESPAVTEMKSKLAYEPPMPE